MASSLRCRLTGCDLDPCGVCRRCGDVSKASHTWKDADREKPCYKRKVCELCGHEEESPDHQWEPTGTASAASGQLGPDLKCGRCGLVI